MNILLILIGLMSLVPAMSMAGENGLINKKSRFSVKVTLDRLEKVLRKKAR